MVERRIGLLFALFLLLLAAATARAGYLVTFQGSKLQALARSQQVENLTVIAKRGTITDRHGTELAVSEDASTVYATPYLVKDSVGTARKVAPLLGKNPQELVTTLADHRRGFAYLARKIDPKIGEKIDKLGIEGIGVTDDARRYYPEGSLAAQLVGTVGVDGRGLYGIEQSFNSTLHGSDGRQRIVKDARGDPISFDRERNARSGKDLRLTIDTALQERTEAVLAGVGQAYQPKDATAIVTDPSTGEILAMANWPRANANSIGDAPPWARNNHAVGLTYEPGSTFKPITVAGALSEGIVTPDTTFSVGSQIQVADRVIQNAHGDGGGALTVGDILARSSNVGAVMIGLKLGRTLFDRWVRRFGFGKETGIPLPGESPGIILPLDQYSGSSMGNMPIGQGIAVTPLQMVAAYSAIANGGRLVKPRIIESSAPPRGRRVTSRRTSRQLAKMLEGVLGPSGTAPEAAVAGYAIAGKTGTAEKAENGGYSSTKFVASFIGYAPARNARLLIAVIVDEPQGANFGGVVAAPAFEKIASFALPYLGIAPSGNG